MMRRVLLTASTTHSTVAALSSMTDCWTRLSKVHPPLPQPGALDAAGGGGGVVQDDGVAGQALVLCGLHLTGLLTHAPHSARVQLSLTLAAGSQSQTLEGLHAWHHTPRLLCYGAWSPPLGVRAHLPDVGSLFSELVQQEEVDGSMMVIGILDDGLKRDIES